MHTTSCHAGQYHTSDKELPSRKDERLSWPSWLTSSGRFTHIRGHPSATGRAQVRDSSPANDRRSTSVLRNQPWHSFLTHCVDVPVHEYNLQVYISLTALIVSCCFCRQNLLVCDKPSDRSGRR